MINNNAEYYRKLITSEYRHAPKFSAMVQSLVSYGLDLDDSVKTMISAFEVDNASTAQLDILGAIVGVSRELSFEPSVIAWGNIICPTPEEIAEENTGTDDVYTRILTPDPANMAETSFLSGPAPLDLEENNLDDDVFRLMIKSRIIQNTWKGTIIELYELWEAVMGVDKKLSIEDLQDMSYNIVLQGDYTPLEEELIIHAYIIPKPEGVRINLLTFVSTDGLPLFAYDYNTMRYSGYSSHWAEGSET